MYQWRKLSPEERKETLEFRKRRRGSWRRPPVLENGLRRYMMTAACYEHKPIVGLSETRMLEFESRLLERVAPHANQIFAHTVLPNHYHLLVEAPAIKPLRMALGKFHGAMSHQWNGEEQCRGRKVFHGSAETLIKSDRHFWACLNYIHHNPVRHGYVMRWQDWPYSSATAFLESVGRDEALQIWSRYNIKTMGRGWDED